MKYRKYIELKRKLNTRSMIYKKHRPFLETKISLPEKSKTQMSFEAVRNMLKNIKVLNSL